MATHTGPLQGKVALVTGSTSGIGLGVLECLASKGCHVVITGLGDPDAIQKIKDDIKRNYKVDAEFIPGDLSKASDIAAIGETLGQLYPTGVDILVNNAGLQYVSPLEELPDERWDLMISVMLTAPFRLIKMLMPSMRQKGWGRIVNIGSVHSIIGSPNKSAYTAAKHGIAGLTKVTALETAGSGVTCNVVCPGYVNTPLMKNQLVAMANLHSCSEEEAKNKLVGGKHPSREFVEIEQVAAFVAFLCSPSADQITGSVLTIDGGWTTC